MQARRLHTARFAALTTGPSGCSDTGTSPRPDRSLCGAIADGSRVPVQAWCRATAELVSACRDALLSGCQAPDPHLPSPDTWRGQGYEPVALHDRICSAESVPREAPRRRICTARWNSMDDASGSDRKDRLNSIAAPRSTDNKGPRSVVHPGTSRTNPYPFPTGSHTGRILRPGEQRNDQAMSELPMMSRRIRQPNCPGTHPATSAPGLLSSMSLQVCK